MPASSPDNPFRFDLLERERLFQNVRYDVFLDHIGNGNGVEVRNFLVVKPRVFDAETGISGVVVVPEKDGQIGLMRTYSHTARQIGTEAMWQVPGGFMEPGETPATMAARELREETGLRPGLEGLIDLGSFHPNAGIIEAKIAMFAARNVLLAGASGESDAPEPGTGTVHWFPLGQLKTLLMGSDTVNGTTLVACFRYLALIEAEASDPR